MAKLTLKLFGLLLWLIILYMIGILLFTKGFLLKRTVVDNKSVCKNDLNVENASLHNGCWMKPKFSKAILLIVDALRYDFVAKHATSRKSSGDDSLPYINQMDHLDMVLEKFPERSRLYKFMADPPTTTMQRLKGITTGSLPTFVDAGSNFASEEILEDNFIDQFIQTGKNIVFMGDDTWEGLFPNRFLRKYSYPSLNVKDLDTVDNGVLEHLFPEMKTNDWDMIIGHFLGVDHCGHTFGPRHSRMSEKLNQMDDAIKKVMENMDDDTILFVMGDHGMTETGDHGGDSTNEVEAALFVYSKQLDAPKQMENAVVQQIDLVPTMSLILGAPIPYSNLGAVITDLFSSGSASDENEANVVNALRLNAHQVRQYLNEYVSLSPEFSTDIYDELQFMFRDAEEEFKTLQRDSSHQFQDVIKSYISYLHGARKMCSDSWAKFDLLTMCLGVLVFVKAMALSMFIYLKVENKEYFGAQISAILVSSVWVTMLFSFITVISIELAGLLAVGVTSVALIVAIGIFIYQLVTYQFGLFKMGNKAKSFFKHLTTILAITIFFVYCGSLFSNSFVIYEDVVTSFVIQTLVWIMFVGVLSKIGTMTVSGTQKSQMDIGRVITSATFRLFCMSLICCLFVRLTAVFRSCREEQQNCESSVFLVPLSNLEKDRHTQSARYFFSLVMILLVTFCFRLLQKWSGNMNGENLIVICAKYVPPVVSVCIAMYWALHALPAKIFVMITGWQITFLPLIVYGLSLISFLILMIKPLSIYLVKEGSTMTAIGHSNDLVQHVYKELRSNWKAHFQPGQKEEKKVLVYGLGTVYSSPVVFLVTVLTLIIEILVGDGLAPSVSFITAALFVFLEIVAVHSRVFNKKSHIPIIAAIVLNVFSTKYFFATGHQATIANIHWQAAFVGFEGNHSTTLIPALLVVIETFGGYIICTVVLPLLIFWPMVRGSLTYQNKTMPNERGEYALKDDSISLRWSVFKLMLLGLFLVALKLLMTMLCVSLHRRHLMVWKIFAPRFVYEGIVFILSSLLSLFVLLFLNRIDNQLDLWLSELEKMS